MEVIPRGIAPFAFMGDPAMTKPRLQLYRLQEAAGDPALSEAAPAEARELAKGLDKLLALPKVPKSIQSAASGLRTALHRRLSPWDADDDDSPPEPPPPGETKEAAIEEPYAPWPLEEGEPTKPRLVRIIAPGWGASGYYTNEALRQAERDKVFKSGLHMYWNHPTQSERRERPERDLRDLAATLTEDARYMEAGPLGPGLYAKAQPVKHYAESIANLAPHIGTSIRALGSGREGERDGRKGRIIEAFTSAQSVDFVTAPGAGGKIVDLFESARPNTNTEDDMDPKELEEARRKAADAEAKLVEAAKAQAAAESRAAQAESRILMHEAADHIRAKLAGQQLPEPTKERVLREAVSAAKLADGKLDTAALDTAVDEAVKAEAEYLEKIVGKGRVQGMGSSSGGGSSATLEESSKALDDAFALLPGLGGKDAEAARKLAVAGRN